MTSIILPVYNRAPHIAAALDSVRAQTDPDWEAIVVDDCSTDDSRAVIQEYIARHNDPRIRLVWPEKNGGVSAARNLGVSHARGDWLAFLDGDDKYAPEFLAVMRAAVDRSGAGLAHCEAFQWDDQPGVVGVYKPHWHDRVFFPRTLCTRNYILPGMMLCSRAAWLQVGPFDPHPRIQHVEDWDWILRAVYSGVRFSHVPRALLYWRRHGASATAQLFKQYQRARFLFRKHAAQPLFAPMERKARVTALRDFAFYIARRQPERALRLYTKTIRLQPAYLPAYARWLATWLLARGWESYTPRWLRFPPALAG